MSAAPLMPPPPMPPPLKPPGRDARLDAIRGWLQLSIFASHIAGGFVGGWLIHAAWGVSDSSEQFVFLSGFGLGSVFLYKQARQGFAAACRDMAVRFARLWRMHLVVFLGFGAMVTAGAAWLGTPGWDYAMRHPVLAALGGTLLVYQPPFMGILPMFLIGMAALLPFLWLVARFEARALLMPAALYVAAQLLPADLPALGGTSFAFSPPGWVPLFLLGAWFGRRVLFTGRAVTADRRLVAGALAIVALGTVLKVTGTLPGWLVGKEQLAPLRALHALSLAYLVAALVPRAAAWTGTRLSAALGMIGRHSLPVFSLGLFLSWLGSVAVARNPLLEVIVVPAGAFILWALARSLDARRLGAGAPAAAPHMLATGKGPSA
ncbi:hypothetical protein EOD42_23865 [Rhodovarius crocodyli]|uniref:OpgC domain-containing protein n=1 Tax=Rhodovarius crocodyli TaxID=1979269 RepID=A0A437LXF1_9PROT|nr:OpgC domain-containing protein [Rhodovarius crocodyli]RVT90071.1 hypothetical protein EOD42_23865 [Rhodovarius crocodyli]